MLCHNASDRLSWLGRTATCVAALLVVVLCGTAAADDRLLTALQAVTNQSQFEHAHWGMLFVDLTSGEIVIEQQADKLFVPASTAKRTFFPERSPQPGRASAHSNSRSTA